MGHSVVSALCEVLGCSAGGLEGGGDRGDGCVGGVEGLEEGGAEGGSVEVDVTTLWVPDDAVDGDAEIGEDVRFGRDWSCDLDLWVVNG